MEYMPQTRKTLRRPPDKIPNRSKRIKIVPGWQNRSLFILFPHQDFHLDLIRGFQAFAAFVLEMEGDATGEKQFEKYILQQFTWDTLPPEVKKQLGNTKDTWKHHVCRYSIRHQLRWKTNLVKQFILDEKQYYLEVLRFSRTQYMVRPSSPDGTRGLREKKFCSDFSFLNFLSWDRPSEVVLWTPNHG
jgi:hypothetical protein